PRFATRMRWNIGNGTYRTYGTYGSYEPLGRRVHLEERLVVLDRLLVLHQHLGDDAAALGLNLVEYLHRLDDAHDRRRRDPRADGDKRRRLGVRAGVEGSGRRTLDGHARFGRHGRPRRGIARRSRDRLGDGRSRGGGGRDGRLARGRRLRAAAEADALVAFDQVDFTQVVPGHQADERLDGGHVERPRGLGCVFVRHRVSPLRDYANSAAARSRGRVVNTSDPSGVTSTSSSMRTPPQPSR